MSEKKKKDKETGKIIIKRDISGVERRSGRDVREGYEQSGVERRVETDEQSGVERRTPKDKKKEEK